jgi:hypothetical protein
MFRHPWLEAHYPRPAEDCTNSELGAVEHAILKFEGLRPEVLKKHGLFLESCHLTVMESEDCEEYPLLHYSSGTCALCHRHRGEDDYLDCDECILTEIRNGHPCDETTEAGLPDPSPYYAAMCGDPEPMLKLLYEARQVLKG